MKKDIKKIVEISFLGVMFLLTSFNVLAQPTVIEPGDKSVNPSLLKIGKFTWGANKLDIARLVSVQRNDQEITIETRNTKEGRDLDKQTVVLNAKTLEPIRQNYTGEEVSYNLQYGARVKGGRTIFDTNEKETLNEAVTGKFFDKDSLPFVISSLPLSLDYRVTLPVINITSNFKPEYLRYRITKVSEMRDFSCISGYRDVWKVSIEEKKYSLEFDIFIDKATRRILLLDNHSSLFNGMVNYGDKETDINPIKAVFDGNETKAMLTGGNSSIKGQASTKIFNGRMIGNKTQYAPKGSIVALIPNTPYFKEWVDFNLTIGKISPPVYLDMVEFGPKRLVQGCAYPLPEEVKKYILVTDVLDDKGNFVFQNLKPGEYLVFVNFVANKYTHTTRTPTGNYTVTVNADGTGSATQIIDVKNWMSPQNILNYKFIKINKEGETVSVKLN